MRVTDTRKLYDGSKQLLGDLYAGRCGRPLGELTSRDLSDAAVRRALTELKTYHLPPIFEVPSAVRGRVPLVQEFDVAVWHETRFECPSCGKRRELWGEAGICLSCHDEKLRDAWWADERPYGCSEFRACVAEHHKQLKMQPHRPQREEEISWANPKDTLLACEIGCRVCGAVQDWKQLGWFWSADTGYSQGACPACAEFAPGWFANDRICRSWQDEYAAVRRLHRTIERYGTMALLLVSPSPYWVNWVLSVLPTGDRPPASDEPRLGKRLGHLRMPVKRPRSLQEVGVDLDDVLKKDKRGQIRIWGEETVDVP